MLLTGRTLYRCNVNYFIVGIDFNAEFCVAVRTFIFSDIYLFILFQLFVLMNRVKINNRLAVRAHSGQKIFLA